MTFAGSLNPSFYQSLWQDCDSIYMQHQSNCLTLQDNYQVNVNLLLLAIWLDSHHQLLDSSNWQQLQQILLQWEQKLLLPYRKLRRLSKAALEQAEYQQMLDVELMLERKSQAKILRNLKSMALNEVSSAEPESNIGRYLALFNLDSQDYPNLGQ
ncbi:TIGR02444 family protein [Shewanella fidelis]|uniref:TIGR02444 family protein n=1 Tax=Shewanella fidelis TaxID=173509 RepID=UPI00048D7F0B|nr:TIGR02444 family protein [Shewanella fidelis]